MRERLGIYCQTNRFNEKQLENYEKQELLKKFFEDNRFKKLNIAEIYVDLDITYGVERKEYNRLIKDIFEGNIDKLVVIGNEKDLSVNDHICKKIQNTIEIEFLAEKYEKAIHLKEEQLNAMHTVYRKIMFPNYDDRLVF